MKLNFTKMHGLGNDFVLIDNRTIKLKRLSSISKKLCDRRLGIGADQLLILEHSTIADFRMEIFNPDGSEVEMCGNGVRCLGKYIWDNILRSDKRTPTAKYSQTIQSLSIETIARTVYLEKAGKLIKVNMGEPILEPALIPVNVSRQQSKLKNEFVSEFPLKIKSHSFKITCVSMGNPHAVIVVKDVQSVPLDTIGPLIENNSLFPNRTNVEFIQILDKDNIKMRVWERGAGQTMACGTGASASAVASILLGLTNRKITVHLPGGKLLIQWSVKDNHVYMTGNAVSVFNGTIEI